MDDLKTGINRRNVILGRVQIYATSAIIVRAVRRSSVFI